MASGWSRRWCMVCGWSLSECNKTQDIEPMLGPTLIQHCFNVSCLLGGSLWIHPPQESLSVFCAIKYIVLFCVPPPPPGQQIPADDLCLWTVGIPGPGDPGLRTPDKLSETTPRSPSLSAFIQWWDKICDAGPVFNACWWSVGGAYWLGKLGQQQGYVRCTEKQGPSWCVVFTKVFYHRVHVPMQQ